MYVCMYVYMYIYIHLKKGSFHNKNLQMNASVKMIATYSFYMGGL